MVIVKRLAFLLVACILLGCGPDTIFLRQGLDTPSQHVANGHQLLERGKIDDACREFVRAKELDPDYIKAYVGLALALGHKGDMGAAMRTMGQAKEMADSAQDRDLVHKGFEQLSHIKPPASGGSQSN